MVLPTTTGRGLRSQVGCELGVIFLLRMQSCVHILRVPETSYHELSSCLQGSCHTQNWIKAWPRRRSADSAHSLRKLFVLLGGSRAEILSPRKSIGESFRGGGRNSGPKAIESYGQARLLPDPHWPLCAGPLSILPSWTLCFHSTRLTGSTGRLQIPPIPISLTIYLL